MTFDLSPEQQTARARARAFAASLQPRAADIDREALVPPDVRDEAAAVAAGDELTTVVALEEIAAESAAVAVAVSAFAKAPSDKSADRAAGADATPLGLAGLRGAPTLEDSPAVQLALAAIAVGAGRKALEQSLEELRRSNATRGAAVEKPHWVVADVATELDAARLLTYKAARSKSDADIAIARLMASAAAERAAAAALRIAGAEALAPGSILERLSRDVRALALLLGTEERQRATAAEGLLPG